LHLFARFAHGALQEEVDNGVVPLLYSDMQAGRPVVALLILDVELLQSP
jgi:hypothetical protein